MRNGTIEQSSGIGGINVIEAHGVGIGGAQIFLQGRQLMKASLTNTEGFAGQFEALFQALAVQQLVGIATR